MSNGARTRDILDHNQVLYQLSYTHHVTTASTLTGVSACTTLAHASRFVEIGSGRLDDPFFGHDGEPVRPTISAREHPP